MSNTNQSTMITAPRFSRTDVGDGAGEILTLVQVTSGKMAGVTHSCADLDGAEYPYLVEVCSGPEVGDDFVGLFDLDGDRVDVGAAQWERATEAPAEVVQQIEQGWESGTSTVTRLTEGS